MKKKMKINDLPNELILKISNYIPFSLIINNFMLICKDFYNITNVNEYFWKQRYYFFGYPIKDDIYDRDFLINEKDVLKELKEFEFLKKEEKLTLLTELTQWDKIYLDLFIKHLKWV